MSEAPAPQPASRAAAKKELPEHFRGYKHVWVFIEQERGEVHPVSWELLGAGRKLADKLGVQLCGAVFGAPGEATRAAVAEAFRHGADVAYLVEDPILADYRNESYSKALTQLVNAHKPEILLLGATTLGRDLAGSVATTLLTGLTADCTELAVDADGSLAATRPTFGGSLLCTIYTLNYRPQMATVRPRQMPMPARDAARVGQVIPFKADLNEDEIITKIFKFIPDRDSTKSNLAFADVVVAGGLGLQSAENFQLVRNLASVLGRGVRRLAAAGAERLDRLRPSNRPDRQDHSSQALYRGRDIRRHSTPRRRRRRRYDRGDQHRQERADIRLRASWHRHRRHQIVAGADGSFPQTPVAA